MHTASALVAIVDDEESVRQALGRLVRSAGFQVRTFGSGSEFLGSLADCSPCCVVLDLRMPHMTGVDVQRALLASRPGVPVVIITGDDTPEIRRQTLAYGATAYLRKPVDETMLLDAIQRAIAKPEAPAASRPATP
ncbi:response regulator [Ramlibacter sp. PS3R-8]|uniref:response regulator transcription factor n=1 Tax=Ramlibacter sp. PS3R-8 TaxID=3133437 RepID=UPI003096E706